MAGVRGHDPAASPASAMANPPPRGWRPIERLGDRLPQREGRREKTRKKKSLQRCLQMQACVHGSRNPSRPCTGNRLAGRRESCSPSGGSECQIPSPSCGDPASWRYWWRSLQLTVSRLEIVRRRSDNLPRCLSRGRSVRLRSVQSTSGFVLSSRRRGGNEMLALGSLGHRRCSTCASRPTAGFLGLAASWLSAGCTRTSGARERCGCSGPCKYKCTLLGIFSGSGCFLHRSPSGFLCVESSILTRSATR